VATRKVVAIIEKYKRFDTTIVGNLKEEYNLNMRKIDGRMATCCTVREILMTQVYLLTGLLPYVPIHYESLATPYPSKAYIGMKLDSAQKSESLKSKLIIYAYLTFLVGSHNLYNPIMSHLNKRGVLTSYWVLNDDQEI